MLLLVWGVRASHPTYQALSFGHMQSEVFYPREPITPDRVVLKGLITLYRGGMGASKGQTCPMTPSCSGYALEAISRYGATRGLLMSVDRLNRCGHDLQFYSNARRGDLVLSLDNP
jgi:putative component of membrane protein insertase Oxa1/YidC/SpoIIIJ protein YidD